MAADLDYKKMLLELDKSLNAEELKSLLFLCKDDVRKREKENVKRPTDLWEILETREKLGPSNLEFLKQIIGGSCNGRLDVLRIIENFENGISNIGQQTAVPVNHYQQPLQQPVVVNRVPYQMSPSNPTSAVNVDRYSKEINFLTKNLGKEWRFFMRTLGVTDGDMLSVEQDYPRNLRDQIYQCLVQWIRDNGGQFDRGRVIAALRDSAVERYDLAGRIEDHDI